MYLRCNRRFKDGKEHCYWNIVEAKRCADGRVVQRQVLYLREINDSQHEAWCRVIEVFDEDTRRRTQLAGEPRSCHASADAVPGSARSAGHRTAPVPRADDSATRNSHWWRPPGCG